MPGFLGSWEGGGVYWFTPDWSFCKKPMRRGRSPDNPIGGWYGLKKGLRGRFGVYLPPLLEALGLCELEHNPKNNRMRAK